jgi:hypothetical protein
MPRAIHGGSSFWVHGKHMSGAVLGGGRSQPAAIGGEGEVANARWSEASNQLVKQHKSHPGGSSSHCRHRRQATNPSSSTTSC